MNKTDSSVAQNQNTNTPRGLCASCNVKKDKKIKALELQVKEYQSKFDDLESQKLNLCETIKKLDNGNTQLREANKTVLDELSTLKETIQKKRDQLYKFFDLGNDLEVTIGSSKKRARPNDKSD